jgi:hypothetical protein
MSHHRSLSVGDMPNTRPQAPAGCIVVDLTDEFDHPRKAVLIELPSKSIQPKFLMDDCQPRGRSFLKVCTQVKRSVDGGHLPKEMFGRTVQFYSVLF